MIAANTNTQGKTSNTNSAGTKKGVGLDGRPFIPVDYDIFGEVLTPHERSVYLELKKFQGTNNCAYPSHRTLARLCSISVSSVKRAINSLVALGLLKVISGKKKWSVNKYFVAPYFGFFGPRPSTDCSPNEKEIDISKNNTYIPDNCSNLNTKKENNTINSNNYFEDIGYCIPSLIVNGDELLLPPLVAQIDLLVDHYDLHNYINININRTHIQKPGSEPKNETNVCTKNKNNFNQQVSKEKEIDSCTCNHNTNFNNQNKENNLKNSFNQNNDKKKTEKENSFKPFTNSLQNSSSDNLLYKETSKNTSTVVLPKSVNDLNIDYHPDVPIALSFIYKLRKQFGTEETNLALDVLIWQDKNYHTPIRNHPGLLKSMLTGGYNIPQGYLDEVERKRRAKEDAKRRQRAIEKARIERAKKEAQQRKASEETDKMFADIIETFYSLSKERQEEVRAQALKQIASVFREQALVSMTIPLKLEIGKILGLIKE